MELQDECEDVFYDKSSTNVLGMRQILVTGRSVADSGYNCDDSTNVQFAINDHAI